MVILLHKLIVYQIRCKLFYCLFFLFYQNLFWALRSQFLYLPGANSCLHGYWLEVLSWWACIVSMYTGFAFISTLIKLYLRQYAFSTIVDDLFLTVTASIHSDLFFAYAIWHSLYFSCSSRRIDIWVTSVYSKDCNEHKAIYGTANNVYIY